ncbi:MAG: hypothetical protein SPLUMA2_SPLUMAMAG2_00248 [uncultured Sulfurimonas sp.]|nr:MAG: hypothetical protein SPLUMA1_SPLUMAMAG1_00182 [uncultured Sulfurimonas sp.]CAI6152446.1 MAG: hypothetical protein SPLUMA2_SPLUMAMAG2_00248 [uncultured Sulfurimonas sp.]
MKSSISRQHLYLIFVSLFLLVFVIIFAFGVLIPEGKEYRAKRIDLKKMSKELREYQNFHNETFDTLKTLQGKNRRIITAFDMTFNPEHFEKQNKSYFSKLSVSVIGFSGIEDNFAVYEVNTTSQISSPSSFYNFLDSVNKSDWIIGINFPINFKRDGELIMSSFTMKVYVNKKDKNSSTSMSEAK